MTPVKKYTAVKVETFPNNYSEWSLNLTFGPVIFEYGMRESPYITHDTEEEAIEYAFNTDKYSKWLILPIIQFDEL